MIIGFEREDPELMNYDDDNVYGQPCYPHNYHVGDNYQFYDFQLEQDFQQDHFEVPEDNDASIIVEDNRSTDKMMDMDLIIKKRKPADITVEEVNIVQKQESPIIKKSNTKKPKIKHEEQVETKNLSSLYIRMLCKHIRKDHTIFTAELDRLLNQIEKKLNTFNLKNTRDFLSRQEIREIAVDYFQGYQFLHDLLSSGKQQSMVPPIKYLNKMIRGAKDPESLTNWKD